MKEIPLTRGKVALVDDEDFDWLNQWNWHAINPRSHHFYAARNDWSNGKRKCVYMHRLVAGANDGERVDHRNGNGLDNRRCNVRLCTRSQNRANTGPQKNNISGYRGVSPCHRPRGKWLASLQKDRKMYYFGTHDTPEEAARAYNKAALKYHGEFAYQNIIKEVA